MLDSSSDQACSDAKPSNEPPSPNQGGGATVQKVDGNDQTSTGSFTMQKGDQMAPPKSALHTRRGSLAVWGYVCICGGSIPEVFRQEDVSRTETSRSQIWNTEEDELMVIFQLSNLSAKNINQMIKEVVLPEGSTDSISGHRKSLGYLDCSVPSLTSSMAWAVAPLGGHVPAPTEGSQKRRETMDKTQASTDG